MTLQNRVTPWGEILAVPDRGAWLGNRGGCFHDERQELTHRRWATKQWITCVLEFKGWRRALMQPGLYTELFFMDEATALAAGHRPCYLCRRTDALRFRAAFAAGNPELVTGPGPPAPEIDAILHDHRLTPTRTKRTFSARLADLPDGTMVVDPESVTGACLVLGGSLRPWSFAGYGPVQSACADTLLDVLTPAATVNAIRAGYLPQVHPSAGV